MIRGKLRPSPWMPVASVSRAERRPGKRGFALTVADRCRAMGASAHTVVARGSKLCSIGNEKEKGVMDAKEAKTRRKAALDTPTNLTENATRDISAALTALLADMFALYLKTKNFHWHVSGPHFRDYHLLLDEQGEQIFATTDDIAERVRKIGGTTLRSIGHIARVQRVLDNDADFVAPADMLAELRDDNKDLTQRMRETHALCDEHGDVATASLLETWIDEAERRTWFLFEAGRS
jgi:starvation-inducible DNA-binding protein